MNPLSNDQIDREIEGTSFSETLRAYSTQRNYVPSTGYNDFAILGFGGNDRIIASHGDDELFGGSGNDTFQSFYGYNEIIGGTGEDTLDYSWFGDFTSQSISLGVYANLSTGDAFARNSTVRFDDVFESIENVTGSDLRDSLTGNSKANDIEGLDGSDYLSGGSGKDAIEGGTGSDRLRGGLGEDTLTGGTGFDRFEYTSIDDSNEFDGVDFITDFDLDDDLIDLSRIDADEERSGNQSFDFIDTDTFSGLGGGEVRYRVFDGFTVIFADTNGDRRTDFTIDVDGVLDFIRADFIL